MKYISTRGGIAPIAFCDAVMMGLATDGGLLLPERIPDVRSKLESWRHLSYPDLAKAVLAEFIDDIPEAELATLIDKSYSSFTDAQITPIVPIGDLYVQEMFHGPTLAFKDLALQLLGNIFEYILEARDQRLNILAATSGDTGSAAIYGVRGKQKIQIFVLHPHKKVSPLQERQMTTVLDDNVHNIAIKGTFDDGQRIIKDLFGDIDFKETYHLGAVNSVNWARVLAQIVYYFYGAFRVQERCAAEKVNFSVPTGNFGNIFAGYLARRMGAPINKLILATNENDILSRFLKSGHYALKGVHQTLSPSMDIQVASNFERYLYYQCGEDSKAVTQLMQDFKAQGDIKPAGDIDSCFLSGCGDRDATLVCIQETYEKHNYILDPHTAVGVSVAQSYNLDEPTICLATAHPAKFPDAVKEACGQDVHHPALDALTDLQTRCDILPADNAAIRDFIQDHV